MIDAVLIESLAEIRAWMHRSTKQELMMKIIDLSTAVAAERERCAKILSDYADARAYDPEEHEDLMEVVAKIRSGE